MLTIKSNTDDICARFNAAKAMMILTVLVFLIIAAGCVSTRQYAGFAGLPYPDREEFAEITIIASGFHGGKTYVYANGREIGLLGSEGFLTWLEKPGDVLIYCKEREREDKEEFWVCHGFRAEKGKGHFFLVNRTDSNILFNLTKTAGNVGIAAVRTVLALFVAIVPTEDGSGDSSEAAYAIMPGKESFLVFKPGVLLDIEMLEPDLGRDMLLGLAPPEFGLAK